MTVKFKKLREVAQIVMGTSPKGQTYNTTGEGLPLLNGPTEFGERHPECTAFTSASVKECEAGDLIFCVRGSTTGRMNWADRIYSLGRGVCAIRGEQETDTKFIRYCLDYRLPALLQLAGGTTFPNLPQDTIKDFEIPYPVNRREIAVMLSAYDELMENNRRRMELLEEAARLLYREWFVRLRFPGYEHARIANGIPSGWRKVTLGSITTKIGSGATPRGGSAAYLSRGVTLIRSLNVYDDRFEDAGLAFISEEQASELDNVTVQSRDILLNITGASVARCCMAPDRYLPARVNQHVMIIRVDTSKADPFLVHAAINSDERKRQLLSYAQKGSTREALTKDMVSDFEVTLPTDTLMRQYGEFAQTCFLQRENLALQNQKLRAARDLLLPRLMSGEIEV